MATPQPAFENDQETKMSGSTGSANAASDTTATDPGVDRRLAINLSERAYTDLRQVAASTSRPMSDVIKIGIGLYKVAAEVSRENNKLMVVSRDGRLLKEIVLPTL